MCPVDFGSRLIDARWPSSTIRYNPYHAASFVCVCVYVPLRVAEVVRLFVMFEM